MFYDFTAAIISVDGADYNYFVYTTPVPGPIIGTAMSGLSADGAIHSKQYNSCPPATS